MLGNFLAFIDLLQIISNNCNLCNANPKTDLHPKQQENKKVYSVTKKSFLNHRAAVSLFDFHEKVSITDFSV